MWRMTSIRVGNASAEYGALVNDEWRIEASNPLRIFLTNSFYPSKPLTNTPGSLSAFLGKSFHLKSTRPYVRLESSHTNTSAGLKNLHFHLSFHIDSPHFTKTIHIPILQGPEQKSRGQFSRTNFKDSSIKLVHSKLDIG